MEQPKPSGITYEDYAKWDDEKRWEIIDGEPFMMSPAPRTIHQRLLTKLSYVATGRLRGSKCEALVAPVDIKLSDINIVQPDLVVLCNRTQDKELYVEGPPTLVVEILSPSSFRHDRIRKLNLYARFGIKEYWIVTPEPAMLEILTLSDDGRYSVAAVYSERDTLKSPTLPMLEFDLVEVFGEPVEYPDEVREGVPPMVAR